MKQKRFDHKNRNQQHIIAGMAGLIEEGLSPHEVFELLDEIKQNTFLAMSEMAKDLTKRKLAEKS